MDILFHTNRNGQNTENNDPTGVFLQQIVRINTSAQLITFYFHTVCRSVIVVENVYLQHSLFV